MTLANLKLIKSRTSRTSGLQKINENPDDWEVMGTDNLSLKYRVLFVNNKTNERLFIKCPYGGFNSELYCKETYAFHFMYDGLPSRDVNKNGWEIGDSIWYSVNGNKPLTGECDEHQKGKWRSPMMMPEWASRYHIILYKIGCQRIQSISEEDCIKEGIIQFGEEFSLYPIDYNQPRFTREPLESFKSLLDTVNPDNWNRNLWNWALYYTVKLK